MYMYVSTYLSGYLPKGLHNLGSYAESRNYNKGCRVKVGARGNLGSFPDVVKMKLSGSK
jgi:hypothetical protein